MTREDDLNRLRTALMEEVDEAALAQAVRTRLAAPAASRRPPRLAPGMAFASFLALTVMFGAAGWHGGEFLIADPLLDIALGSVAGVLQ